MEKEKSENESNTDSENSESEYVRVRLPRQGEILGIVTQILGADRIKVRCMDKKDRVVRIPGKHRKRLWCRQNDIVSVMPWYGLQEDTRGDLVYRYNKNQANWLEEKGYIVLD
ncbi:MAG: translation initiation factor eIF-1A [Candidatus Heimdallarchaeota archaeon]|nr:translation initiation factor eIF-1A [Candidatus Heimdallarchaeota archaeon]